MAKVRFSLGQTVITRGALAALTRQDVLTAVRRHSSCDWGDVCPDDWQLNDAALKDGTRLLSAYRSSDGTRFWVITEADRSATTFLLPEPDRPAVHAGDRQKPGHGSAADPQ